MKIIYEGINVGDHTARYKKYWPPERYDYMKRIKDLKSKIIEIPTTKEEAKHNQVINYEVITLKEKVLNKIIT